MSEFLRTYEKSEAEVEAGHHSPVSRENMLHFFKSLVVHPQICFWIITLVSTDQL